MNLLRNTLNAWKHAEILNPVALPDVSTTIGKKYVKNGRTVEKFNKINGTYIEIPARWEALELKNKVQKSIGLYGACYTEFDVMEFQRKHFQVEDEIHNKSYKKLFGFYAEFDENLKYKEKSLFIPHMNFYIKLLKDSHSHVVTNFTEDYEQNLAELEEKAKSVNGGVLHTLWLEGFLQAFKASFSIPTDKFTQHYLEFIAVDETQDQSEQMSKFNSFYIADIEKAIDDPNDTLIQFVHKPSQALDINENRAFIEQSLHPLHTPLGRWPSQVEHRLSLMQQVAVNEFFRSSLPISSVNGPPGTGKTTLLKDVFAEIVVRKAWAMLAFKQNPAGALLPTGLKVTLPNSESKVAQDVYTIDPSIAQYAAVVAPSNNTAVENISKDLPKEKEIHASFQDELEPLAFAASISEKMAEEKTWGMFSMPLGKGDNIKKADALLNGAEDSYISSLKEATKGQDCKALWLEACEQFEALYNDVARLRQQLAAAVDKREAIGDGFILSDDAFWMDTAEQYAKRQKQVLFQTDHFNEQRSRLFLKALVVVQRFVTVNREKMEPALYLLGNRQELDVNTSEAIEGLKAMWHTVHCICPVVSTTLASFGNMYKLMPKDFIPYLFIDEAGQALPTNAVGALWRSRKVLVVGDPLQIEPVQTLSEAVLQDIRKIYSLDAQLLHVKASVQSLADRADPLGTSINEQWIGIPLWVHRRCLNPMFSISNELAYNGKMVIAQDEIGTGEWLHCKGKVTNDKYVNEQGEILFGKLSLKFVDGFLNQLLTSAQNELGEEQTVVAFYEANFHDEVTEVERPLNEAHTLQLLQLYLKFRSNYTTSQIVKDIQSRIEKGELYQSIYIITPFKSVKETLVKELNRHVVKRMTEGLMVLSKQISEQVDAPLEAVEKRNVLEEEILNFQKYAKSWLANCIGTVHTFQGKEADCVYFVTGTDETKLGAAEWACKEPNLLNVAVTRAKKEFYIIGNVDLLKPFPNYQIIVEKFAEFSKMS